MQQPVYDVEVVFVNSKTRSGLLDTNLLLIFILRQIWVLYFVVLFFFLFN